MSTENDDLPLRHRIIQYFTRLEFYQGTLGSSGETRLSKNDEGKAFLWTLAVYFLLSAGIFCRQITNFPKSVHLNLANLQWDVVVASLIFGLAYLPQVIRKLNEERNKKKKMQKWPQVLSAFGIGFFIDFASNGVIHYYFK